MRKQGNGIMKNSLASNQLSNQGIKELVSFIDNNDLNYIYVIFAILMIITNCFTWFVTYKKIGREIKQLDADTGLKRTELISKYQYYRNEFHEASLLLQLQVRDIISEMQQNSVCGIIESREDLKGIFFNEFIPKFNNYLEIYEVEISNSKKKKLNFIDNDIFRLFKSVEQFYLTVNNQHLLNRINQSKLLISKETVILLINFVDNNIGFADIKRKMKVNEFLKHIELANVTYWGLKRKYK